MKKLMILLVLFVGCIFVLPLTADAASLLTSLQVEGVAEEGFNLSKNNFNIDFSTSLDYVNIITKTSNENVKVEGAGKVSIKEGANKLVVTASEGDQTETYTINLNVTKITGKAASATSNEKDVKAVSTTSYDKDGKSTINPDTGAFLNYSLLIGGGAIAIGAIIIVRRHNKFYRL